MVGKAVSKTAAIVPVPIGDTKDTLDNTDDTADLVDKQKAVAEKAALAEKILNGSDASQRKSC